MRGVRAFRQAPLVIVFILLSSCQFEFQLITPSIEVDAQPAYQVGNNITIGYKFTADEPTLRCRYTVDSAGSVVQQGVTGDFPPGTWQQLTITLDPDPVEGEYAVKLIAQAPRADGFVDLSFLKKTVDFILDSVDPVEPILTPAGGLFNATQSVSLSHEEWTQPSGSLVRVFYTIDHTDPTSSSSQYLVGSPITVELSEAPTEIRAIAIDDSGRQSAVWSETYRFINILHMQSQIPGSIVDKLNTTQTQFIDIYGYGLLNVTEIKFTDRDGTHPLTTAIMERDLEGMGLLVAVSFPIDGSFAADGTTADGTLKVIDASNPDNIIAAEVTIDLIPEP